MRLLFVDDDPSIVQMLKTVVEVLEPAWQTRSAESGPRALKLMETDRFDVIISDMGMPGMTGAQLLNEVMRRYPQTSRILLSGYSERDPALRLLGATHQFLPKPFAIPAFQAALHRIRALRDVTHDAQVEKLVPRDDSLPRLPAVYFKLLEVQQDAVCREEHVAEILAGDPGLTGKTLQTINSGLLTEAYEVSTADEAIRILGVETIRSLLLCVHLLSAFDLDPSQGWCVDELWRHSGRVAQIASKIALIETGNDDLAGQAFTAGLLHEVGRLLLARNFSTAYVPLIARAAREKKPLLELENEAFGATHAGVGACLLHLWGLATSLIEAVALQYAPSRATEQVLSPLTLVHVANILEEAAQSQTPSEIMPRLDACYLDKVGLSDRLPTWQQAASELCQATRPN